MGSGIAQVAAQAGLHTIQFDVNEAICLKKVKHNITTALQKLVEKNKIPQKKKIALFNRLTFTHKLEDCKADVIIEAIIENKEAKIELFNQLAFN